MVRVCATLGVPFVARGAGTGLSGGAMPIAEGIVIGLARMNRILEVDVPNRRARVQPGVTNLEVSQRGRPARLYYAPDPSASRSARSAATSPRTPAARTASSTASPPTTCSGWRWCCADGELVTLGGSAGPPGYDLLGVFVGSEGTLGIATEVMLRFLPLPEAVRDAAGRLPSTDEAGEAVSRSSPRDRARGHRDDGHARDRGDRGGRARAGYPVGAGAVLLVELDGPAARSSCSSSRCRRSAAQHGAVEIRIAADAGRAGAAVERPQGRVRRDGPHQPRLHRAGRRGPAHRAARRCCIASASCRSARPAGANVFHAGDGNLHPLVLYDAAIEGQAERAEELAGAILELLHRRRRLDHRRARRGRGEGLHMPRMYRETDMAVMLRLRSAFDPPGLCNPDKVFPTPRLCGEVPGPYRQHPAEREGVERL